VIRIDEKTVVPLGVVAALFTTGISITAMGVFWITSVNERLSRIEQRLGIVPVNAASFVPHANAGESNGFKPAH